LAKSDIDSYIENLKEVQEELEKREAGLLKTKSDLEIRNAIWLERINIDNNRVNGKLESVRRLKSENQERQRTAKALQDEIYENLDEDIEMEEEPPIRMPTPTMDDKSDENDEWMNELDEEAREAIRERKERMDWQFDGRPDPETKPITMSFTGRIKNLD
jgi:hypothetical protein